MELAFVGDVMLGREVNEHLRFVAAATPWDDTLPLLAPADLRIANLECALSDRGSPWMPEHKAFHFRSDSKNVAVLTAARIDAVSLANNHALDFGEDALLDTLTILERAGIACAGAGIDAAHAMQAARLRHNGLRVALLACTDNEPTWAAGPRCPGVWYVPIDAGDRRARVLLRAVERERPDADIVIVALHWGSNWGRAPEPGQAAFARALIDAGADVIYGHSPHVFRGIGIYRGRPVLYGTGDFIDDYAVSPTEPNDESFVFTLAFERAAPRRLHLYPTLIDACQAHRARGDRARDIAMKMRALCAALGVEAQWQADDRLEIVLGSAPEPSEKHSDVYLR